MAKKKKKTSKKTSRTRASTTGPSTANRKVERAYPRVTLEEAAEVAEAIKAKNNGKPFATADVASALDCSAKGAKFFYQTAASRDYGFTLGTRDAAKIELTELGRRLVYPSSASEKQRALLEGFRNIRLFSDMLDHYGGSNLPEFEYVSNTLAKEFGLDLSLHDEFIRIFSANCRFLDIGDDFASARHGENAETRRSSSDPTVSEANVLEVGRNEDPNAPLCFVILPFSERDDSHPRGFFDEVLRQLIVPAAEAIGFRVRTAKKSGSDVIQQTIVRNLLEADLVVADLTEHNPNVMFELGLRMAQEKPVAILKAEGTGPLFDVDHMIRVYSYSPCLWTSTVSKDLANIREHIEETWKSRDNGESYLKLLRGGAVAPRS